MPANTPRGFPYPLPTEPVAEGAQRIRELAEALDAKVQSTLIQAQTPATNSVVTFSAIPQIYQDLQVRGVVRTPGPTVVDGVAMQFNGQGGTSYNTQRAWTEGTVSSGDVVSASASAFPVFCPGASAPDAKVWGTFVLDVFWYRRTAQYIAWQCYGNGGHAGAASAGRTFHTSGFWYGASPPVTSLTLFGTGGVLAGSHLALYGIV